MPTSVIVLGVILTTANVGCMFWEYFIYRRNQQIYHRVLYKWRRYVPRQNDKYGTVEIPTVRKSRSVKTEEQVL